MLGIVSAATGVEWL